MAKITLTYWFSEKENHTSVWEVPYFDIWPFRQLIDNGVELGRLRRKIAGQEKIT